MTIRDVLASWACFGAHASTTALKPGLTRIEAPRGVFHLKRGDSVERVLRELELLQFLSTKEFPSPVPIPSNDGRPYVIDGEHAYWLSRELAGEHVEDVHGTSGLVHAGWFGRALGELHRALSNAPNAERFPVVAESADDLIAGLLQRSTPFDPQRLTNIRSKLPSRAALPAQLIHRDAHPRNLLFRESRLSGFLDFELVHRGPRLFDLCYCASAIFSGTSDVPGYGEYWLRVLRSSFDAYDTVLALTAHERSMTWTLLVTIELVFMGYLLDCGNAEGALKAYEMLLWIDEHRERVENAVAA